jgi:membrane protease YdiL (CAAX protease family)
VSTIKALVTRHPASAYFVVTFAISWGAALVAIGGSGGMRGTTPASDPRFVYALMAMLAGPSLTGILLTAVVYGREGLRTDPFGGTRGLSAGVFEELGWTGFAIPTLRRRYRVLATGLAVGVWWSAWHLLPNVWSSRAAAGELDMSVYLVATVTGVFVGYLTAFRVLMVWVYEHTASVLVAMLMHASFTASLLILNPVGLSGTHLVVYSFALAAAVWVVVAAVATVNRQRRSRAPVTRRAA